MMTLHNIFEIFEWIKFVFVRMLYMVTLLKEQSVDYPLGSTSMNPTQQTKVH